MAHMPRIAAYQPLQEKAYYDLKKMIEDNILLTGVIYSETKLSKELGISRTPFRSAMHRLVQEGYIEIIPSKGFCLRELKNDDIHEAAQMLCAVEAFCAVQLSNRLQQGQSQVVYQKLVIINQQMDSVKNNSPDDYYELNNDFHSEIVKAQNNKEMIETYNSYLHRMNNNAFYKNAISQNINKAIDEHNRILLAIQQGEIDQIYLHIAGHSLC